MSEQNVTINEFAIMIKKGFDGVHSEINEFRVEVNQRFEFVNKRFDVIEGRLDRIEKFTLIDFKRRIEKAELDIHQIKEALAM